MKLFDFTQAPNPRRVRIFLAEKGVSVPCHPVDLSKAEHRQSWFIEKNPIGRLPVLELDDGTTIAESVAICRYFEGLHPEPPLMGTDSLDRALVEMWQRRMELYLFNPIVQAFRNTSEYFKGRIKQVPQYGEVCREEAFERMQWLDGVLAGRQFVAGNRYTIADITTLCAIDFGKPSNIRLQPEHKNLARWYQEVSSRPSAKA